MAKKVKEAKIDGTYDHPLPWVEPFPESVVDSDGKETIYVRATTTQDIILNGHKRHAGVHTLPCDFAHSNAAVLSAPPVPVK